MPPSLLIQTHALGHLGTHPDSDSDSDSDLSPSSLFDASYSPLEPVGDRTTTLSSSSRVVRPLVASLTCPPIPGLFFDPTLLIPPALASSTMSACIRTFFSSNSTSNQAMLFSRPSSGPDPGHVAFSPPAPFLADLLAALSDLLRPPALPAATHARLFSHPDVPGPGSHSSSGFDSNSGFHLGSGSGFNLGSGSGARCARQAIVNVYRPGQGIAPHVDLPARYADGVVSVSLGAGCAMRFARVAGGVSGTGGDGGGGGKDEDGDENEGCELWLPPRSVLVLTGDARYAWTHGIVARDADVVQIDAGAEPTTVPRETRVSVTFRWLLPGADVVGG